MIDNESIALDLEALLSGSVDEGDFRRKYQSRESRPVLDAIWGNLQHYLDDADVRARDSAYRAMQDRKLRKLIQLLRRDAPITQLRGISFLSPR
jgi:hypothetical protein